jgi:hypothetical protein
MELLAAKTLQMPVLTCAEGGGCLIITLMIVAFIKPGPDLLRRA